MILSFRYTYVRQAHLRSQGNDSGTNIQGRNADASYKPIYTEINLRRIICVSKEAMESGCRFPILLPWLQLVFLNYQNMSCFIHPDKLERKFTHTCHTGGDSNGIKNANKTTVAKIQPNNKTYKLLSKEKRPHKIMTLFPGLNPDQIRINANTITTQV
ncbi:Hypothetical_protein [Hexamita inflata]|uniref:Hypothetical_protein n=1 Tax=Hexamita inflata TaxID=28002 RepID=A0ABP1K177_9EUKA